MVIKLQSRMPISCCMEMNKKSFVLGLQMLNFFNCFVSNIVKFVNVNDYIISKMKSYDSHIFMQKLLSATMSGYLRHNIHLALMKFSTFFKELCVPTCKKKFIKRRMKKK